MKKIWQPFFFFFPFPFHPITSSGRRKGMEKEKKLEREKKNELRFYKTG